MDQKATIYQLPRMQPQPPMNVPKVVIKTSQLVSTNIPGDLDTPLSLFRPGAGKETPAL